MIVINVASKINKLNQDKNRRLFKNMSEQYCRAGKHSRKKSKKMSWGEAKLRSIFAISHKHYAKNN